MLALKCCPKCLQDKPATLEFFPAGKTKSGLNTYCRVCAVELTRAWRKANPDRARVSNTASTRRWRKEHPDQYKIIRGRTRKRRRAERTLHQQRSAQLPRTLTLSEWQDTLRYFDHRCAYCRRRRKLQHEHLVPVCQGGGFTKENIIPACADCNYRKGARTPEEAAMPLRKPWPITNPYPSLAQAA